MTEKPRAPSECTDIGDVRTEIDRLDRALVSLLAERARCVDRVVDIKRAQGLPALIPERVEAVAAHVRKEAEAQGLDPDFAERLWREMMAHFIAYEEERLGR